MSSPAESQLNAEYFQSIVADGSNRFQQVAFTNTSAYSQNLESNTTIVELFSTQDCWIQLVKSTDNSSVAAPVAANTKGPSLMVRGGITKFIGVPRIQGTVWKLAVIRDSANGTLDVCEGA